ncbi:MAG: RNA polymerase-associated protein RapA [Moraxella sp.]
MTDFAIGQRYLSDTENELGLGVVVLVDDRCVHILFPQSEETRVYAKSSAPLSRVTFNTGDTIHDQDGQVYQVQSAEETNGVFRYYVEGHERPIMETRLAANINLAKPLERLLASRIHQNDWYELRQELLRTQAYLASHPLRGLMGARVDIIEHQLYIAHEVGKRIAPRVLLADEVGLGKTIEAGLIIHQQLTTGKAERVLVLVPDSLQYQWMIELRRRFNLEFAIFDLVRTAAIAEHDPEQNPFLTEQLIVASVDLLLDHEDLRDKALEAGFDLLVVDEAHHLHWDSEQGGNDKYDLVEMLAKQTAGVLLLTATPEQLGLESHFARLRLLDPNRFSDLDDFIDSEDNFAQTAAIAEVLLGDMPLSDNQKSALQQLLGHDITDDEQGRARAINELLDRHGTGRVLFRNTRESVAELISGFQGRRAIGYPLPLPNAWQASYHTQGKLREQLWSEELQPDGSWLEQDPRVPWLIELLKSTLKHQKVLLIARSGATVESLEAVLRLHAGIKTAIFTEQMSLLERDQAAAYFADYEGAQVLLASEIGSEGRNFQFASDLVLFDLPANPDTLEQRIGRLDRIGQQHQITIHVPYVEGTATERLYHWYNEALNIFSQISPTAQTVQEQFIVDLKPILEGKTEGEVTLAQLVNEGKTQRLALEAAMQAGRDRLLEYNSCRPRVANKIAHTMRDFDDSHRLPRLFEQFMSSINMEYSGQRDGSLMLHPSDEVQVQGLAVPEEGMTLTFERDQALLREDMAFMTYEHPLMQSIFETVNSGTFGNTTVATLKSNAMPEGLVLVEVNFRVEAIAPKLLNLPAYLPKPLIRVFLSQQGTDFSEKIAPEMIASHIQRLDKTRARQVIKARKDIIEARYHQAVELANTQLEDMSEQAKGVFTQRYDREIERLQYLQSINPNVRDSEINQLKRLQEQGLQALTQLSLIPDSIRVLVAVKPN